MLKRCGFLATAVLLAASPAGAITISGVTITFGASNTANNATPGGSSSNNTSQVSVLSTGGTVADAVDASVSAQTRYASNLWADGAFGDTQATTTNSYDLSLSVSAGAGTVYDIVIDSLFSGALNHVDDASFGEASASVSAVSVTLNSVVSVPLATTAQLIALDYYDASLEFSQAGQEILTDLTGTTDLTFNVEWTSLARSFSDEAAVLLGLDEAGGPVGLVTVGEYSGFPTRNPDNDGHFLSITANVTSLVPEPSTALLLATGLVILGVSRRRG